MMIATGRTILGLMLLCTLPGIIFGNGNWDHCPENITVYTGCDVTIYALFKANNSQNCGNGFVYHIHIRESGSGLQFNDKFGPNDPVPPVIVEGTNGMICNISVTSTVTQPVGVYDIQFLAIYGLNLMNKPCKDHLFVIDTSPFNATINVTCEEILVEWEGPELADGFNVLEYTVTVLGTNIVYNTTNTNINIPYGGCLEYHKQYDVSIAASYCGRIGNSTSGSFYTAIDPMIDGNIIEDPLVYDRNATSCSLYLKFKMSRDNCRVSHPKTVTTNMSCTSSLVHGGGPKGPRDQVSGQPVTVRHDGSIIVDTTVPVDNKCTIELMFNNGELSTSTDPFDIIIDTNQLDSCSFIVNESAVAFLCKFSLFSSLWGCRIELTGSRETAGVVTSHMCNSNIVMIGMPQGLIGGLCNGVYSARCYGLRNDTSTPDGRNDTAQIVAYDYSTDITVTASDTCTSSVTSVTSTETCTVTPTLEPSVNSIATDDGVSSQKLLIAITFLCVLTVLILFILVGLIICSFLLFYRKHTKGTLSIRTGSYRNVESDESELSGSEKGKIVVNVQNQTAAFSQASSTEQRGAGDNPTSHSLPGDNTVPITEITRIEDNSDPLPEDTTIYTTPHTSSTEHTAKMTVVAEQHHPPPSGSGSHESTDATNKTESSNSNKKGEPQSSTSTRKPSTTDFPEAHEESYNGGPSPDNPANSPQDSSTKPDNDKELSSDTSPTADDDGDTDPVSSEEDHSDNPTINSNVDNHDNPPGTCTPVTHDYDISEQVQDEEEQQSMNTDDPPIDTLSRVTQDTEYGTIPKQVQEEKSTESTVFSIPQNSALSEPSTNPSSQLETKYLINN